MYPCGELSFFPRNDGGNISFPFVVHEEPIVIAGAGVLLDHSVQLQVTPDDGANWQDVYIHGLPVQLTALNNLIYLPLAGKYRWVYTGTPIGRVTGTLNTLTHGASVPLVDLSSVG